MGAMSRIKSFAGGDRKNHVINVPGLAAATIALDVPDESNLYALTTGEEGVIIGTLIASQTTCNRKVTFYMKPVSGTNGYVTLTNTDNAAVAGQMDLGGSDITLDPTDVLVLLLRPDGTWLRLRHTDN